MRIPLVAVHVFWGRGSGVRRVHVAALVVGMKAPLVLRLPLPKRPLWVATVEEHAVEGPQSILPVLAARGDAVRGAAVRPSAMRMLHDENLHVNVGIAEGDFRE